MSVFANAGDPETVATGVEALTFTQATVQALKIAEAANVPIACSGNQARDINPGSAKQGLWCSTALARRLLAECEFR